MQAVLVVLLLLLLVASAYLFAYYTCKLHDAPSILAKIFTSFNKSWSCPNPSGPGPNPKWVQTKGQGFPYSEGTHNMFDQDQENCPAACSEYDSKTVAAIWYDSGNLCSCSRTFNDCRAYDQYEITWMNRALLPELPASCNDVSDCGLEGKFCCGVDDGRGTCDEGLMCKGSKCGMT
jgi:hypothetical protein